MEHEWKSVEILTKTERRTCVCVSYLRPGRRRPTAAPQLSAASSAAGCSAGRTRSSCRRSRSLTRLGALQLVAVSAGVPEFFCSLLDFSSCLSLSLSVCLCLSVCLSVCASVRLEANFVLFAQTVLLAHFTNTRPHPPLVRMRTGRALLLANQKRWRNSLVVEPGLRRVHDEEQPEFQ